MGITPLVKQTAKGPKTSSFTDSFRPSCGQHVDSLAANKSLQTAAPPDSCSEQARLALLVEIPADCWRERSEGSCHQCGFALRRGWSSPLRPDNLVGIASDCQQEPQFGTLKHNLLAFPNPREAILGGSDKQ